MIRVIILGPGFPLRGGIANMNEALCRALNKAGADAKIVSFSLQYPAFLFPGTTQFDTGSGPADIRIIPMVNSINPITWFRTASFIKKEKPDLLIVRYWLPFMAPSLGTIIRRVKRNTKIKIIAITDNIIPHERRPGDKVLTRYFAKACEGFIAMSRSVLNELSLFNSSPYKKFLPHPVYNIFGEQVSKEAARKHLQIGAEEKIILFFGFIRKYKGLDLLLEAMSDGRIKKLGIKLIIAGEFYDDPAAYHAIIERNKLQDQVILRTSYIHPDEVKHYFCGSDLVVQPYRSATQSGVAQIAYHFEKPVLVTDVGGLSEIVSHLKTGYVVPPDPGGIANAIIDFYTNSREASFSANTAEEKKRFLWETFTEELLGLYSSIPSR